jgi:hypothetical protein
MFWDDLWGDSILADDFPHLFSFVRHKHISVEAVMEAHDLDTLFFLPLSREAFAKLQDLQLLLQSFAFDRDSYDSWVFI